MATLAVFSAATFLPMFENFFDGNQNKLTLTQPTADPTSPAYGPENAKLQIVVFGDFLCPISKATSGVIAQIAKDYPKDVRIIWKDFPNIKLHPNADILAGAARCAKKEGKFWKFHDLLFENQKTLSAKNSSGTLLKLANDAGLNKENFINCVQTEETLPLVEKDFNEGKALKISGTPYLFINDIIKINGAATYEELEAYLK
jgi:protein-disulfide isomerase